MGATGPQRRHVTCWNPVYDLEEERATGADVEGKVLRVIGITCQECRCG